ncbi:hypothetical protein CEXT_339011 [Caerostris extrusa]|uniref:Uncharacterized protein n=1 Tax=Caerostris extrusa TaxID=172846 RepID=A0AAV4NL46_CAEEX|nr:hypothetical protein CEXT_339011 [Caerostris extrusa]
MRIAKPESCQVHAATSTTTAHTSGDVIPSYVTRPVSVTSGLPDIGRKKHAQWAVITAPHSSAFSPQTPSTVADDFTSLVVSRCPHEGDASSFDSWRMFSNCWCRVGTALGGR